MFMSLASSLLVRALMNTMQFRKVLAAHVLKSMVAAQREGKRLGLDQLVAMLSVRRADVRATLSALHEEGMIDVTRMRLTLRGFALGTAFEVEKLERLRTLPTFRVAAA